MFLTFKLTEANTPQLNILNRFSFESKLIHRESETATDFRNHYRPSLSYPPGAPSKRRFHGLGPYHAKIVFGHEKFTKVHLGCEENVVFDFGMFISEVPPLVYKHIINLLEQSEDSTTNMNCASIQFDSLPSIHITLEGYLEGNHWGGRNTAHTTTITITSREYIVVKLDEGSLPGTYPVNKEGKKTTPSSSSCFLAIQKSQYMEQHMDPWRYDGKKISSSDGSRV
uniref:AlNc14C26G2528 protein n=1 Tax=Albugo laibachii Nc14 TaxID=890382 RepID=F0W6P0_9STRA|nr:AlNc14C26G2528 [Albugo laibachii Nc14]|eukprot:CCA16785.1 AlNc14C26G2528 [Albugo laibachii Nc14]